MKNPIDRGILSTCFIVILLHSFISDTFAQFDSLGINTKWKKGSLVLTDNVNLNGQIQFNDKLGIIKFKKNQGDVEQSFSELRILEMQFYDEDAVRWRNFASFNVREDQTGYQGNMLLRYSWNLKTLHSLPGLKELI